MKEQTNRYPKLHNAMWPGLVGKGSPGAESCIDLETMLGMTAAAEVDGVKFDGVDIFLSEPHIAIDISDDDLRRLSDEIAAKGLAVGSVVAPIWAGTGGGSAMGSDEERARFVLQVRKGCRIGARLREWGLRPSGVVRIDSASGVEEWSKDPENNTRRIAETLGEACNVAEGFGERLAFEGEICWGGMHSWRQSVKLLEAVGRPRTLGFQADMAHTLLFILGYNAPEDALVPPDYDWKDASILDDAYRQLTNALRPWTIDFHVAQNDATVKGSGTHDKTGHHCLATDLNGKLDITRHAGFWLRDANNNITRAVRHICWDGCMFPNEVMMLQKTWNDILAAMIAVRNAHGWTEELVRPPAHVPTPVKITSSAPQMAPAPKTVPRKRAEPSTARPVGPAKGAALKRSKDGAPKKRKALNAKLASKPAAKRLSGPAKKRTVPKRKVSKARAGKKVAAKSPRKPIARGRAAKNASAKSTRPRAKAVSKRRGK